MDPEDIAGQAEDGLEAEGWTFVVGAANSGNALTVPGGGGGPDDYSPGDLAELDRAIRHLPIIVEHMAQKAKEAMSLTNSSNFEIFRAGGEQRARVYVKPSNFDGILEELKDAVLLKAAIAMQGR